VSQKGLHIDAEAAYNILMLGHIQADRVGGHIMWRIQTFG